ncbi:MAG TPA: hypothetical protein DIU20_08695 [Cryomorphaceae bacterium]|nr:hypothetical protein [Cryomorphaceae bacterium]
MTKEEYIEGKMKSGFKLHKSHGVWWETSRKGYCKPALMYEPLSPKEARPSFSQSYIGYNYRVKDKSKASGFWMPFIMGEEGIKNWSLDDLKSGNRRRRIRKGLRENEVQKIDNVEDHKESIRRILKSTAIRNGHGYPPEFYDDDESGAWWKVITDVANYTEFWCSFSEGTMSAYICLHVIGDRVIVDGVKSDTDLLQTSPIDAIVYSILANLQKRGGIKEMWYGGKSTRPTLDSFKESFGFEIVEVPFKTEMLGGIMPYPKFLNNWIKRGVPK